MWLFLMLGCVDNNGKDSRPEPSDSPTVVPTEDDPNGPPAGEAWRYVAASDNWTCGIRSGGTTECWGGAPEHTSYGTGSTPTDFGMGEPPGLAFDTIDLGYSANVVGEFHGCGLLKNGEVVCWGRNDYGQASPVAGSYVSVVTGEELSAAITVTGEIVAWGWVSTDPFPASDYLSVAAGTTNVCGVSRTGAVDCLEYEIGAVAWEQIAIHSSAICGIDVRGTITCQTLSTGEPIESLSGPPGRSFVELCVGPQYACGRDTEGSVECWGTREEVKDVPIASYQQIDCGIDYACGVNTQGKINCWGRCSDPGVCDVPI